MKRIVLPLVLFAVLLSGCTSFAANAPLTDQEMSTRVAAVLTDMPQPTSFLTPTTQQIGAENNAQTVSTEESAELTPTPTATELIVLETATSTPILDTPTPENTATVTSLPTETPTLTNTPIPTSTPPSSDPRSHLGAAASTDPMDDSKTWNWPTGVQDYTAINFKDGYMVLTGLKTTAGWRLPVTAGSTDVYIEMTVKTGECTGKDNYGIIFRIPVFQEADRGYIFAVSCDGKYRFTVWDGKEGENGHGDRLIDWRSSPYILTGSNQINRVGVMTIGDRFYLYVNGYLLNKDTILTDDTYPGGNFGVFVTAAETKEFTIYIDEMSYWLQTFTP